MVALRQPSPPTSQTRTRALTTHPPRARSRDMRDEQTDRPESDASMAGRQDAAPTRPLSSVDQRMAGMTRRGTVMAFQLGAALVASAGGLILYRLPVERQGNN